MSLFSAIKPADYVKSAAAPLSQDNTDERLTQVALSAVALVADQAPESGIQATISAASGELVERVVQQASEQLSATRAQTKFFADCQKRLQSLEPDFRAYTENHPIFNGNWLLAGMATLWERYLAIIEAFSKNNLDQKNISFLHQLMGHYLVGLANYHTNVLDPAFRYLDPNSQKQRLQNAKNGLNFFIHESPIFQELKAKAKKTCRQSGQLQQLFQNLKTVFSHCLQVCDVTAFARWASQKDDTFQNRRLFIIQQLKQTLHILQNLRSYFPPGLSYCFFKQASVERDDKLLDSFYVDTCREWEGILLEQLCTFKSLQTQEELSHADTQGVFSCIVQLVRSNSKSRLSIGIEEQITTKTDNEWQQNLNWLQGFNNLLLDYYFSSAIRSCLIEYLRSVNDRFDREALVKLLTDFRDQSDHASAFCDSDEFAAYRTKIQDPNSKLVNEPLNPFETMLKDGPPIARAIEKDRIEGINALINRVQSQQDAADIFEVYLKMLYTIKKLEDEREVYECWLHELQKKEVMYVSLLSEIGYHFKYAISCDLLAAYRLQHGFWAILKQAQEGKASISDTPTDVDISLEALKKVLQDLAQIKGSKSSDDLSQLCLKLAADQKKTYFQDAEIHLFRLAQKKTTCTTAISAFEKLELLRLSLDSLFKGFIAKYEVSQLVDTKHSLEVLAHSLIHKNVPANLVQCLITYWPLIGLLRNSDEVINSHYVGHQTQEPLWHLLRSFIQTDERFLKEQQQHLELLVTITTTFITQLLQAATMPEFTELQIKAPVLEHVAAVYPSQLNRPVIDPRMQYKTIDFIPEHLMMAISYCFKMLDLIETFNVKENQDSIRLQNRNLALKDVCFSLQRLQAHLSKDQYFLEQTAGQFALIHQLTKHLLHAAVFHYKFNKEDLQLVNQALQQEDLELLCDVLQKYCSIAFPPPSLQKLYVSSCYPTMRDSQLFALAGLHGKKQKGLEIDDGKLRTYHHKLRQSHLYPAVAYVFYLIQTLFSE